MIAVYLLAIQAAKVKGAIDEERYAALLKEMETLPDKIQKTLDDKERIQWFASKYANAKDIFFIGRGIDYAISLEGSLKMKEISYIHPRPMPRRIKAWNHQSDREDGTLVVGGGYPESPVREDSEQHGRGKEPWSLPYGPDPVWKL